MQSCPLALECDALAPRGAYRMCGGPCVPHGEGLCTAGASLEHQQRCALTCTESHTQSYTPSGDQPYCFGGALHAAESALRCEPDISSIVRHRRDPGECHR